MSCPNAFMGLFQYLKVPVRSATGIRTACELPSGPFLMGANLFSRITMNPPTEITENTMQNTMTTMVVVLFRPMFTGGTRVSGGVVSDGPVPPLPVLVLMREAHPPEKEHHEVQDKQQAPAARVFVLPIRLPQFEHAQPREGHEQEGDRGPVPVRSGCVRPAYVFHLLVRSPHEGGLVVH